MKSMKSILALTLLVALVLPLSIASPAVAQPTTCRGLHRLP